MEHRRRAPSCRAWDAEGIFDLPLLMIVLKQRLGDAFGFVGHDAGDVVPLGGRGDFFLTVTYSSALKKPVWNVQGVKSANRNFQPFLDKFKKLVSE